VDDNAFEMHMPRKGPADVLVPLERRLSAPGAGEVRVAIEAAGVAYADIIMRQGIYPGWKPPLTPGYDFVGRIEALGPEVAGLEVGQRVAGVTIAGSYATRRNVDARWLVLAPESADAVQLVAATMNGLTAWQMFHRLTPAEPGEWVLVHGAAGGVGSLLLDFVRMAGVRAIGTASAGKASVVTAKGAEFIDYRTEDVVARALSISDGGVVAAYDHMGGKHFRSVSMRALRPGGVGVLYGGYDATRDGKLRLLAAADLVLNSIFSGYRLMARSQCVASYSVTVWRDERPSAYRRDLTQILSLVAEGKLSPLIGATYPLAEAANAQRALETRSVAGKIVLVV
jgi:NADPH:quinone reductase-like Zn-dependent oxidoreductase